MAAKRANGEGSIYQRKSDKRWTASMTMEYDNGQRRRKSFYGKTQREVKDQLIAAQHAQQQGLPLPPERETVGRFLERWLHDSAKPTIRPKTFTSYAQLVRLHLAPELGRIALVKLSPQMVQAFMNRKLAAGLSPRTVQYLHAVLRRALGQAVKWGLVPRNVATLVDPPRVRPAEVRPFTPDEARAFLAAVRGDRLEALYTVALALGLRQGEALGLRWEDIDLEAGVLTVRVALQRVEGRLQLVEPKSATSRRSIALPQIAAASLHAHRSAQLQDRLIAGKRWQESGLVFTTRQGKPLLARNVFRAFQRVLKAAGMRHQRWHDMRHACATLMLVQGIHPRVVMGLLGHSQISLTMNTYSHVVPALQIEAASRMDAILQDAR